jgi:hypothetical protein
MEQAAQQRTLLQKGNFERAESEMRAAAARVGARLLDTVAEPLNMEFCPDGKRGAPRPAMPPGPVAGCITWLAMDRSAFRFLDNHGHQRLAITVPSGGYEYARLARRGSAWLLLVPAISPRFVGGATQCECDAGPTLSYDSQFFAFVIDDVPEIELRRLTVPVLEDVIEWECRVSHV